MCALYAVNLTNDLNYSIQCMGLLAEAFLEENVHTCRIPCDMDIIHIEQLQKQDMWTQTSLCHVTGHLTLSNLV